MEVWVIGRYLVELEDCGSVLFDLVEMLGSWGHGFNVELVDTRDLLINHLLDVSVQLDQPLLEGLQILLLRHAV